MKGLVPILTFLAGLGIGGVAGWYISKAKAEETKNEEINSSNEAFKEKIRELEAQIDELGGKKKEAIAKKHSPKQSVSDLVKQYDRVSPAKTSKEAGSEDAIGVKIIDETDFDSIDDYDQYTLTYYKEDDVLVDEDGDVIPDQATYSGDIVLSEYFEDHEEESAVYLRSDVNKSDYEILLSARSYEEDYGE